MNKKQENTGPNHKLIGILVILATLTALVLPATIASIMNKNSDGQSMSNNVVSQTQTDQAKCLNDAYNDYEKAWKAADKDDDDKVSYNDGATDITTAYYDNAISCYRAYKTTDSDGYIADYQAKRQQEVDKYNTWVQAVGNATTAGNSSSSNYRSSISCRSSSIGSSTYTTCD